MKKMLIISGLFLLLIPFGCKRKQDESAARIITLNLRYDNPSDSINPWSGRAAIVREFIAEERPDIIGMQEVLAGQYEFLDSVLTDYGSVGVGRDDGAREGEMNPVFFRKERFDMIRSKTFWLSETPEIPGSKSWGSELPRIVTWMELSDKRTDEHFFFFNTHFAHDSDTARVESAKLLLSKIDTIASGFPFVVTGDFNMTLSSKGYAMLTGPYESVPLLVDSYAVSEKRHTGPAYTYNGFSDRASGGRIDYIFVRNGMSVSENRTLIKKERGVYISDHWPVMAEVLLKWSAPK